MTDKEILILSMKNLGFRVYAERKISPDKYEVKFISNKPLSARFGFCSMFFTKDGERIL